MSYARPRTKDLNQMHRKPLTARRQCPIVVSSRQSQWRPS
uniref:Uncharacterized protein n=1 Tax=Arundo donax TaxID=35708 RepID=A0A0A9AI19_ARUDO